MQNVQPVCARAIGNVVKVRIKLSIEKIFLKRGGFIGVLLRYGGTKGDMFQPYITVFIS